MAGLALPSRIMTGGQQGLGQQECVGAEDDLARHHKIQLRRGAENNRHRASWANSSLRIFCCFAHFCSHLDGGEEGGGEDDEQSGDGGNRRAQGFTHAAPHLTRQGALGL